LPELRVLAEEDGGEIPVAIGPTPRPLTSISQVVGGNVDFVSAGH
jgi:hypothetical protein